MPVKIKVKNYFSEYLSQEALIFFKQKVFLMLFYIVRSRTILFIISSNYFLSKTRY